MAVNLPDISVIIVGHNAKRFIDSCLESIKHQTIFNNRDVEVIFIDNGSFDGSIADIQRNYKWVSTVRNIKNVGYPAALNQGIRYSSGEFILLMNVDVILEKDYLEKALNKMKHDRHLAALMGKIYRYDFNHSAKTAFFDTVGIFAMVDREILSARGSEDLGQFENFQEIFSIRNICGFYRKNALEDVRIDEEYFDESFFLYLEDVDLCWRLHLFGWKVGFLPSIVAYHCLDTKKKANIKEYRKQERRYFIKNERLMTIKNEFFLTVLRDIGIIAKKRFWKKSFMLEGWIKGWFKYMRQVPAALSKRKYIMKKKRVSRLQMRKWFLTQKSSRYDLYKSKSLEIYAKYPPIY